MVRTLPRLDPAGILGLVSNPLATKIGHVIAQWSLMEGVLENAIWQAAALRNDVGRAVTSQGQVQGKLDLLEAVLMQTRPRLGEQFHTISDYVRDCLVGRRNIVAHGMWTENSDTADDEPKLGVVKFSARGRLTAQGGPIDPKELDLLAREIAEVTSWLIDFCALLPVLKQRRGGLGHKIPETRNPLRCANLRALVLQPPVARPKAPPKPTKKTQQKKRRVRST